MTLDELRPHVGTTDADGVEWPTEAAMASAAKYSGIENAVPTGDGGLVFSKRIGPATLELEVDSTGAAEVLLYVDSRLVYRQGLEE